MNPLIVLLSFLLLSAVFSQAATKNALAVRPLNVGDSVPTVLVKKAGGQTVDLAQLVRKGKTVLVFYRGGWCPYCNQQLSEMGKLEEALRENGYSIYAVSPDRVEKVAEAQKKAEFSYNLLSDATGQAARAFGLAFTVDDETYSQLMGFGVSLEKSSGESHRELPVPALYVVDQDGKVVYRHYDPDYRERLSEDDLRQLILP